MRFALETARLSDFLEAAAEDLDKVQLAEQNFVPVIVLGEIDVEPPSRRMTLGLLRSPRKTIYRPSLAMRISSICQSFA